MSSRERDREAPATVGAQGHLPATTVATTDAREITVPDRLSLRTYITHLGAPQLVITLAITAVFLPVVLVRYAFSDDYPILFIANGMGSDSTFGSDVIATVSADGRPLAGVLDQIAFATAGTIDNLRFVRLVSLVGIVALALLLHWALVRSGVKPVPAALCALLMCSTPAFLVLASWAVLFNVPLATLLAGGASSVLLGSTTSRRELLFRLSVAIALLLASVLDYQPGAMFFWVFLAIGLMGVARDTASVRRLATTHFAVAGVALILAFLITKLAVRLAGSAANPARNALLDDPVHKASWFVRSPLYKSLNLFDLTTSPWCALLVAAVSVCGILLLLDHEKVYSLVLPALGVILVPLTFLPSLVVREDSPTYRVQVALTSLIVLYAFLGILGIWLTICASSNPASVREP